MTSFGAKVRFFHRWMSVVFTALVVIVFIANTMQGKPAWIDYVPLPALALMLVSGLYLFSLPYVARRSR